jgi:hypothetical protein
MPFKKFKKNLGIDDLGEYLKNKPNALADFKTFAQSLNARAHAKPFSL